VKKAAELNAPIVVPKIGEFIEISQPTRQQDTWWIKP
jgi:hypothetical protein